MIKDIGKAGEHAACRFLKKNGYKILERNYQRSAGKMIGEIDIIARKGEQVSFVEVKTRNIKSLGTKQDRPASAVTPEKQRKIIKAAARYVGYGHKNLRKRFDIIEVYVDSSGEKNKVTEIRHLENSFNIDTAYFRK